jgi:hypothetical protein
MFLYQEIKLIHHRLFKQLQLLHQLLHHQLLLLPLPPVVPELVMEQFQLLLLTQLLRVTQLLPLPMEETLMKLLLNLILIKPLFLPSMLRRRLPLLLETLRALIPTSKINLLPSRLF